MEKETWIRLKLVVIVFVCACSLLLSGCWDYLPLEEKFIVNALGIDISERDPERILVTAMGITYNEANDSLSAEGSSISDAIRAIRDRTDKQIALSHIQVVLFSEQIAKKGVTPYLDIFYRDPQLRSDALVMVAKGQARDFFDSKKMKQPINGQTIYEIVASSETRVGEHAYDVKNVMFNIENSFANISLPLLTFEQNQRVIRFAGMALFDDGMMVAELDERQTIGFLMLNGYLQHAVYTIGSVKVGDRTAKAVSFRIFGPKRKVEWREVNGQPQLHMRFSFKDEVLEISPWVPEKMRPDEFEQLEQTLENDLRQLAEEVLYIVQKRHRLELFDLREMARVKWGDGYHKMKWNEQFAEIPVHVEVDVQIERTGILY
jgi:spore germination protein KC